MHLSQIDSLDDPRLNVTPRPDSEGRNSRAIQRGPNNSTMTNSLGLDTIKDRSETIIMSKRSESESDSESNSDQVQQDENSHPDLTDGLIIDKDSDYDNYEQDAIDQYENEYDDEDNHSHIIDDDDEVNLRKPIINKKSKKFKSYDFPNLPFRPSAAMIDEAQWAAQQEQADRDQKNQQNSVIMIGGVLLISLVGLIVAVSQMGDETTATGGGDPNQSVNAGASNISNQSKRKQGSKKKSQQSSKGSKTKTKSSSDDDDSENLKGADGGKGSKKAKAKTKSSSSDHDSEKGANAKGAGSAGAQQQELSESEKIEAEMEAKLHSKTGKYYAAAAKVNTGIDDDGDIIFADGTMVKPDIVLDANTMTKTYDADQAFDDVSEDKGLGWWGCICGVCCFLAFSSCGYMCCGEGQCGTDSTCCYDDGAHWCHKKVGSCCDFKTFKRIMCILNIVFWYCFMALCCVVIAPLLHPFQQLVAPDGVNPQICPPKVGLVQGLGYFIYEISRASICADFCCHDALAQLQDKAESMMSKVSFFGKYMQHNDVDGHHLNGLQDHDHAEIHDQHEFTKLGEKIDKDHNHLVKDETHLDSVESDLHSLELFAKSNPDLNHKLEATLHSDIMSLQHEQQSLAQEIHAEKSVYSHEMQEYRQLASTIADLDSMAEHDNAEHHTTLDDDFDKDIQSRLDAQRELAIEQTKADTKIMLGQVSNKLPTDFWHHDPPYFHTDGTLNQDGRAALEDIPDAIKIFKEKGLWTQNGGELFKEKVAAVQSNTPAGEGLIAAKKAGFYDHKEFFHKDGSLTEKGREFLKANIKDPEQLKALKEKLQGETISGEAKDNTQPTLWTESLKDKVKSSIEAKFNVGAVGDKIVIKQHTDDINNMDSSDLSDKKFWSNKEDYFHENGSLTKAGKKYLEDHHLKTLEDNFPPPPPNTLFGIIPLPR